MEANGSPLTNKYSEGLPGARYYGGNEYIDLERAASKLPLSQFENYQYCGDDLGGLYLFEYCLER